MAAEEDRHWRAQKLAEAQAVLWKIRSIDANRAMKVEKLTAEG